jgi:hypothetical protein
MAELCSTKMSQRLPNLGTFELSRVQTVSKQKKQAVTM